MEKAQCLEFPSFTVLRHVSFICLIASILAKVLLALAEVQLRAGSCLELYGLQKLEAFLLVADWLD